MALFTKLFERDHDPYDLPGKWIRLKVRSGALVMDKVATELSADLYSTNTSRLIRFIQPKNYAVCDCKIVLTKKAATGGSHLFYPLGGAYIGSSGGSQYNLPYYSTNIDKFVMGIPESNIFTDFDVYFRLVAYQED